MKKKKRKNMMGSNNGEQSNTDHLLQSQAHIMNHVFNFTSFLSLKSAIDLDIPDIIHNHGGPMTLSDLVAALPINKTKSQSISRLMRVLVHAGYFVIHKKDEDEEEEEKERYSLTPSSRLLLKTETLHQREFIRTVLNPVLLNAWHHMNEWFRNDDSTPFETANGRTLWEYMEHEPEVLKSFNDGMARDSQLVVDVVVREYRGTFEGLSSVVDVGGGTGTFAKAIADAFPLINCINFDLPHVIAGLEGAKNLKHVEGDMFVSIPPADAVMLKWIMHDWGDEDCIKILKRCKEAIPSKEKGGKLMIIDMVTENKSGADGDNISIGTQLLLDMQMMVLTAGKERNEKEWSKLFLNAGFSDYKITSILGLRSLIEVYP